MHRNTHRMKATSSHQLKQMKFFVKEEMFDSDIHKNNEKLHYLWPKTSF